MSSIEHLLVFPKMLADVFKGIRSAVLSKRSAAARQPLLGASGAGSAAEVLEGE